MRIAMASLGFLLSSDANCGWTGSLSCACCTCTWVCSTVMCLPVTWRAFNGYWMGWTMNIGQPRLSTNKVHEIKGIDFVSTRDIVWNVFHEFTTVPVRAADWNLPEGLTEIWRMLIGKASINFRIGDGFNFEVCNTEGVIAQKIMKLRYTNVWS